MGEFCFLEAGQFLNLVEDHIFQVLQGIFLLLFIIFSQLERCWHFFIFLHNWFFFSSCEKTSFIILPNFWSAIKCLFRVNDGDNSLVKNSHSRSSLRQGFFPFGGCQIFFVWVLMVYQETYEEKRWRTLKAVVPVQVQIVAVSELAPVLFIRRAVKHWGLLLLWESGLENSREMEQRKTHPVSLFSCTFAFSNNAQDDHCFSLWNGASCFIKLKLHCRKTLFLLNRTFSM